MDFNAFVIGFKDILKYEVLDNSLEGIFSAIIVFIGAFIALRIFRRVILEKLKKFVGKTKTDVDNKLIDLIGNVSAIFYWFIAFYVASKMLATNEMLDTAFDAIFIILVIFEVAKIVQNIVAFALRKVAKQKSETVVEGLQIISKIIIWSIGLLLMLSNLGVNISAIVASMGIGGIAVALAAQNILGDLFASFTIYFDKPFQIGDYIAIGTDSGTVKKIGLKTTRLKTLQGEELIISNKELTESRLQNFKKLKRRRVKFSFGVTYDTKSDVLRKIPNIVDEIVNKQKLAEAERTAFTDFGDFSLNFESVYFVDSREYRDYVLTQHDINLGVKEEFDKENIEMAFPTQTILLQK